MTALTLEIPMDEVMHILTATRIPPHQLRIHRIIGVASSRNLRTFGGSVVWKLAGSELCWERTQALRGLWMFKMRAVEAARWLLEVLGSSTNLSWGLRELPKACSIGRVGVWEARKSRSIVSVGVWRPQPLQNSSSGGVGAAIFDTFINFEASQGATTPIDGRAARLRPT